MFYSSQQMYPRIIVKGLVVEETAIFSSKPTVTSAYSI